MVYKLYPYQKELVTQALAEFKNGTQGVMVVSPAGSGKSVMIATVVREITMRKQHVLFMVHRKELVEQIRRDLIKNEVDMGYVLVSSVFKIKNRLDQIQEPYLIVTDETHHAKAKTYMKIYQHFKNAKRLGFTATPIRLSGEGFTDIYSKMVEGPSVRWLIDNHFLAPFTYYSVPMLDRKKLKKQQGEYTKKSVSDQLNAHDSIMGEVVKTYKEKADGQQAILYAHSVDFSKKYARQFKKAGIKAKHVDSKTPPEEREKIMDGFKKHQFQVLCNVDLVSEGFNVPDCNVVILMRPTESLTVFIQQSMRGMRYRPRKQSIIIDHVGNWSKHGLPDTEHDWTLNATKQQEETAPKLEECPKCKGVFKQWKVSRSAVATRQTCPLCGYYEDKPIEHKGKPELDEDKDVKLKEIGEEQIAYLKLLQLSKRDHTKLKWDLMGIVDIFLARNAIADYRDRPHPYRSPVYFAIRQYLTVNDLNELDVDRFHEQIDEVIKKYGKDRSLHLDRPFIHAYANERIEEYVARQKKREERYYDNFISRIVGQP